MELHDIKMRAKLVVVEQWLIMFTAASLSATSRPLADIDTHLNKFPDDLSRTAIPGMRPEWSDLFSAELEEQARGFAKEVLDHVREMRKGVSGAHE